MLYVQLFSACRVRNTRIRKNLAEVKTSSRLVKIFVPSTKRQECLFFQISFLIHKALVVQKHFSEKFYCFYIVQFRVISSRRIIDNFVNRLK